MINEIFLEICLFSLFVGTLEPGTKKKPPGSPGAFLPCLIPGGSLSSVARFRFRQYKDNKK